MKIIKTILISATMALFGCQSITFEPQQTLKFDPQVEVGTLSNGFDYYIAENRNPDSRVYIRFVVNAGSMNEDDDQRGVAHIVEHMAFNGTKHYPNNRVISELEKAGMKFGVDINAFTDFENTVYTLNLPNNDPATLDLAMDIVADWAGEVTMLKDDLDAERGIVLEEWRARLGPMLRLGDKKSAIEMQGSRYVTRDPIGDVETIKTVSKYRVADFYHKWYRPDNMSIVVVGDVNTKDIKQRLTQRIAQQAVPDVPLESVDYSIPLQNGWRIGTVSEAGITTPSVELSFLSDFEPQNSVARYRYDLAKQIATRLLNVRLQTWEQSEGHTINSANFYSSNLGRETTQAVFSLQLSEPDYAQSTTHLIQFIAQVVQYGFSDSEINGELTRLRTLVDKNRHQPIYSIDLAGDLMVSAASGQLKLGAEQQFQLNRYLLEKLTAQEVNQAFKAMIEPKARLLLLTYPVDSEQPVVAAKWVEQEWQNQLAKPQQSWQIDTQEHQLPLLDLKPGSVKLERKIAKYRLTEYRLSNGSKLIYRHSDVNPGQVHFKAITHGGTRSVDKQDYHKLRLAVNMVDDTGVGELPQAAIQSIFRGNPVVMSTLLDEYQQGFSGWAKTENVGKMLTLFRLKLAQSPVSNKSLKHYQTEVAQESSLSAHDAEQEFINKVSSLRYPSVPTVYSGDDQWVLETTPQQLSEIYQQYIAAKTDYTYFVVGDISPRDVEKLAAQYLASMPALTQQRAPYSVAASSPETRYISQQSTEPRAEVELYLTQDYGWRPDHAYYLEMAGELVQEQLRLELREQASGVYSVTSWFWQDPNSPQAEGRIQFSCAPERVDELLAITHRVLNEVAEQGIDGEALANKQRQRQDQIDRFLRSDLGMLDAMERSYMLTDSAALIDARKRANQQADKQTIDSIVKPFLKQSAKFEAVFSSKLLEN